MKLWRAFSEVSRATNGIQEAVVVSVETWAVAPVEQAVAAALKISESGLVWGGTAPEGR